MSYISPTSLSFPLVLLGTDKLKLLNSEIIILINKCDQKTKGVENGERGKMCSLFQQFCNFFFSFICEHSVCSIMPTQSA